MLGDIVEVCGFYRQTPRIRFVRKAGAACDLCGEKLEESHVTEAVAKALDGVESTWFSLAPLKAEVLGYRLYIEGEGLPEDLAARLDAALRESAAGYNFTRSGDLLAPVEVALVPEGTYDAWRQTAVRAGAAEAQLKTAHLVAELERIPEAIRAAPSEAAVDA